MGCKFNISIRIGQYTDQIIVIYLAKLELSAATHAGYVQRRITEIPPLYKYTIERLDIRRWAQLVRSVRGF